MPVAALDILDTAVKVGLGAVISGVASYAMAGRTQTYALKKAAIDDATALLKEGALKLETSSTALNGAIHAYDAFARGNTLAAATALDFTLESHNLAKDAKAIFFLINAQALANLVEPYIDSIVKIRNVLDDESAKAAGTVDKKALNVPTQEAAKARKALLEALGPAREKIRTTG